MIRKIVNDEYVCTMKKEHNHLVDPCDLEVLKIKRNLATIAKTSRGTTREVIADALAGASEQALA